MRKALRGMAREIGHDLAGEIAARRTLRRRSRGPLGQLAGQLAEEVVMRLRPDADDVVSRLLPEADEAATLEDLERRLERLETTLQVIAATNGDLDDDSADGADGADGDDDEDHKGRSRLPNLKYARPKYKDVESVLRYVETDEQTGGLKHVIMNFND